MLRAVLLQALLALLLTMRVDSSLVAHFSFDGFPDDTYGHGGERVNGGEFVPSKEGFGQALALNGKNQYVSVARLPYSENFSILAWVKPVDSCQAFVVTANLDGATRAVPYSLNVGQFWPKTVNGLGFRTEDGWTSTGYPSGGDVRGQDWRHVAGTYDGKELKYYVDGVFMATISAQRPPMKKEGRLEIGRYAGDASYFGGLIDDLQIHDTALSPDDVAEIASRSVPTAENGALPSMSRAAPTFATPIALTNNNIIPNCQIQVSLSETVLVPGHSTTVMAELPNGPTSVPVVIQLNLAGTAERYVDYNLDPVISDRTITIPAGETRGELIITESVVIEQSCKLTLYVEKAINCALAGPTYMSVTLLNYFPSPPPRVTL